MPSKDFQDFHYSCFDPSFGASRDGLNVPALLRLGGIERAEAERLILQAIKAEIDSRPILAAGHLKLQLASPLLRQRLADAIDNERPYNRVHSAWALYQIEKYTEATRIIVDILQQVPRHPQWSRMMAVESLGDFGEVPLALTTLLETLFDEDNFIAYLATDSLKRIFKSQRAVVKVLNEIQMMQSGHKAAMNHASIQEALEHVKRLAGIR